MFGEGQNLWSFPAFVRKLKIETIRTRFCSQFWSLNLRVGFVEQPLSVRFSLSCHVFVQKVLCRLAPFSFRRAGFPH